MFDIPWTMYSEEEIISVISELFHSRGYEVFNVHATDRASEDGVDVECKLPFETEKVLISVKKKPAKRDIGQLSWLVGKPEKQKIYVFVSAPSGAFEAAKEQASKNGVTFWNADKLSTELFDTLPKLYLFMLTEYYIEREIFAINSLVLKVYDSISLDKVAPRSPDKQTPELLNLLWQGKDRAVAWNKTLSAYQVMFEAMKFPQMHTADRRRIVTAFLRSLGFLNRNSVAPLLEVFEDFIARYPGTFETFCKQSKRRSHWNTFKDCKPSYLPGVIDKTFTESHKFTEKLDSVLPGEDIQNVTEDENLADILADVARIMSIEANALEIMIDGLLGVVLHNDWYVIYRDNKYDNDRYMMSMD